ncbi:hypothetical protein COCMIDRAFT_23288 [Bipolaris oryzae ATCC 44560]|uniref:Uncharacterized protein n=1 Tax=Bipolaris oryzae ATCC 44560 TaxID=930090 RepID=W6ZFV2_COCMI|nr:uncharacterized protein COCMIDRAFT_23288 [Bipolaris oryzae ATCC 44560]EUC48910.1 hypothetical protein COCMIDRAFT_23288 [Bipolaris oryzae ATCC 44560]
MATDVFWRGGGARRYDLAVRRLVVVVVVAVVVVVVVVYRTAQRGSLSAGHETEQDDSTQHTAPSTQPTGRARWNTGQAEATTALRACKLDVTPMAWPAVHRSSPLLCAGHGMLLVHRRALTAHSGEGLDRSRRGRYCRAWSHSGRWQPSGVNTSPCMHRYNEVSRSQGFGSDASGVRDSRSRASMLQIFHVMALDLVRTRTVCANP